MSVDYYSLLENERRMLERDRFAYESGFREGLLKGREDGIAIAEEALARAKGPTYILLPIAAPCPVPAAASSLPPQVAEPVIARP